MLALVSFIAGMQLDMPISTTLMLKWSITIIACINRVLASATIDAIVRAKLLVQRGRARAN